MAIYVDRLSPTISNRKWPYDEGCHLLADTEEELHEFASKILGLKRSYFQKHVRYPHYDLTKNIRKLAVEKGAIEVDYDWFRKKIKEARDELDRKKNNKNT